MAASSCLTVPRCAFSARTALLGAKSQTGGPSARPTKSSRCVHARRVALCQPSQQQVNDKEALHCYYAHTEPTDGIQRRCYWLTEATEDIVLVHYLQLVNPRHGSRLIRPRPAESAGAGTPPSYGSSPGSLQGSLHAVEEQANGHIEEVCCRKNAARRHTCCQQPAYAMPAPTGMHPSYSPPQLHMMANGEAMAANHPHFVDGQPAAPGWGHMPPPPAQPHFRRPVSAFSAAAHGGVPVSQAPPQRAMTAPGNLSADLSMDLSWDMPKLPSLLMDAEMLSTSPDKLPGTSRALSVSAE